MMKALENMMNKLNTLLVATVFSALSVQVYAEPVDTDLPAHQQKDGVPNSTENISPLESHIGTEVDDGNKATDKHNNDAHKANQSKSKTKGKDVTPHPKDGGADINPTH